jgi:S-sulfo-L-cysteine synthase (3-phospho-L-serine-dependent)
MSHVVLVESNTTGTGRLAVERLLAAGDEVTFVTRNRGKYSFLAVSAQGLAVVDAETNDVEEMVSVLAGLASHREVDAVFTFSDFYVAIVAEAAARLGYRSLSPGPARICRNKILARQALVAAGLPSPDFWVLSSEAAASAFVSEIRFPCVIKPPADSSSFGVRLARTAAELVEQVRELSTLEENVRGQRLDGTVLVESYLDGAEFSVETVTLAPGSTRVVGVTDKHLSPHPHFVEIGHDFPSAADSAVRTAIVAAVTAALAVVGFDFGPAHTEVRWTPRGPVVVEINPRLAGGMIPEIIRYAIGIDLLDVWLGMLLGRTFELTPSRNEVASIRFLIADRHGHLAGVTGVAAARALPAIRQVQIEKALGTPVQPSENAYHRLGFVIASGSDREEVRTQLDEAVRLLRIEIVPEAARLALD